MQGNINQLQCVFFTIDCFQFIEGYSYDLQKRKKRMILPQLRNFPCLSQELWESLNLKSFKFCLYLIFLKLVIKWINVCIDRSLCPVAGLFGKINKSLRKPSEVFSWGRGTSLCPTFEIYESHIRRSLCLNPSHWMACRILGGLCSNCTSEMYTYIDSIGKHGKYWSTIRRHDHGFLHMTQWPAWSKFCIER